MLAISEIAVSVIFKFTPSVAISSTYCLIKLFSGSFKIFTKSSLDKGDNSSNNNVTYDKEYTKDKSRSVDVHSQLFSYMGDNKVE